MPYLLRGAPWSCRNQAMGKISCKKDLYQAVTEITFKVVISVLGSLSNVAIFMTFSRSRKLRSNNTLFLCSLSLSGLVFSVLSSPLSSVIAYKWYYKKCSWDIVHVNRVVYHIAFSASISTLTLMSVERSYVICNPLKYKLRITETKAKLAIGITWLVSIAVGITEGLEVFNDIVESIMTLIAVVGCYIIIIVCYVFMFLAIRKQRKVHHEQESRRKTLVNLRRKTERELAKTIGLIVGVFAVTWAPIAYTFAVSPHLDSTGGNGLVSHWALAVGMASAVLNPLIYFFRSREFRKAAKEVICPRGWKCYPCVREENSLKSIDASTVIGKSGQISYTRSKCMLTENEYQMVLSDVISCTSTRVNLNV